jgi:hypothetical protein
MAADIATLERHLASKNKRVRLNALKLMLRHPDSSPLQLVRCLCSEDNRNFEFLEIFDLGAAMRQEWERLRGVQDDSVYAFLDSLYSANPTSNVGHVVHVLELLTTRRALDMLEKLRASTPHTALWSINQARRVVSQQLASDGS